MPLVSLKISSHAYVTFVFVRPASLMSNVDCNKLRELFARLAREPAESMACLRSDYCRFIKGMSADQKVGKLMG